MSLAATLKVMAEAGCSAEQMVAVAEAHEASESERAEKKREQSRVRQQRKREKDASSRNVTHVTRDERDTPIPPFSDKENPPAPPKEINSSPLTPQTTLLGASADCDFQALASKLDAAAGGKINPHSLIVLGPVVEMITAGVSLEVDILPAIKATAARSANSYPLSYFLPAIRQAFERRVSAGKSVPKPTDDLKGGTMMRQGDKIVPTTDARWRQRVERWSLSGSWEVADWGPAPGTTGCNVPAHVIASVAKEAA